MIENIWGNDQQQVALFMAKMRSDKQQVRFAPSLKDIPGDEEIDLRCRLMFEECLETISALKRDVVIEVDQEGDNIVRMGKLDFVKTGEIKTLEDLAEIADGLADQKVVILGTDICFGFNARRIFNIVQGNNNAKFRPGHTYDKGKLIKPPDHKAPTALIAREINLQAEAVNMAGTGVPLSVLS